MDPDRTGIAHEQNAFLLWNDDPRLRNVLAPELLPETAGLQELSEFLSDPIKREHLKSCAAALYDELARQEAQTLEEAAEDIVSRADLIFHEAERERGYRPAPCGKDVLEALLLRYGLVGHAPATLDVMGQAIGRTRERARQIQNKHGQALRSTRPSWPQLDRALELARVMAPCREEDLAEEMIRRKLTAIRYSLKSLQACADFGGRDFELEEADGVVGISSPELAALIHAIKALSRRQGLASLLQISDELVDGGIIMSENDVRRISCSPTAQRGWTTRMSRGQESRRTGSSTPCGQCSPYISRSLLRTLARRSPISGATVTRGGQQTSRIWWRPPQPDCALSAPGTPTSP